MNIFSENTNENTGANTGAGAGNMRYAQGGAGVGAGADAGANGNENANENDNAQGGAVNRTRAGASGIGGTSGMGSGSGMGGTNGFSAPDFGQQQSPQSPTVPTPSSAPTPPSIPISPSIPPNIPESDYRKRVYIVQEWLFEVFKALRDQAQFANLDQNVIDSIPYINPDGIYGPETKSAVSYFQLISGLPITVTGAVDAETWRALNRAYISALEHNSPALGIVPFHDSLHRRRIEKGEESVYVVIIQIMLATLALYYSSFGIPKITGVFDDEVEAAVREFQRKNALPETGFIDKRTWNRMARQFNEIISESQ